MPNHLARERSPYLLQHANNPVDWYPWGDEAFGRARAEDRPVFLSIGYSTCHWCHVMEHESFEDAATAAVLNRDFVCVKVDREERPDIDRVYMTFVQATTGAGGWPMSVWLTPDLQPFFGGTYFPPRTRWGRPGFIDILERIAYSWRHERDQIVQTAATILGRLRNAAGTDETDGVHRAPVAGLDGVDAGIAAFSEAFDARHGGFGGAPKFPRPSELLFLLEAHALTGDRRARDMAAETLRAMARGGVRDHLGGGFHRYSVDGQWRVPHFEKMLYDQAQLVLASLEAAQATGDADFVAVAEDTLAYVARDLTAPDGAFWSAEDADSIPPDDRAAGTSDGPGQPHAAKREGAFYVWTADEVDRRLGPDGPIARRRFGIEDGGNAPEDPHGEFRGQNILYVAQTIDEIAVRVGMAADDVRAALDRARRVLLEARGSRPRPHRDDKVIAAWNGLMIAAAARAARVLVDSPQRDTWRRLAVRGAEAARLHLWDADGRRLYRRYRDGEAAVDGFCEDYAALAWGAIELFQATGDGRWLDWAVELTAAQIDRFFDPRDGGWFNSTGEDPTVLLRLKEDYDGAEPAAASLSVRNLIVLAQLISDPGLAERAERSLERYGPQIGRVARVMPFMLSNVARWHAPKTQIVIAGPEGSAMERVVASRYLPFAVQVPRLSGAPVPDRLSWVAAMTERGGEPAAYVCTDFTCQAPVTDTEALAASLGTLSLRP